MTVDLRNEFGPLAGTYLAHYRRGVLPDAARRAATAVVSDAHTRAGHALDVWREEIADARTALAGFLGLRAATPEARRERAADEIAFFQNTTNAIAAVAHGLSLQRGDAVVLTHLEYPASALTWRAAAERRDLDVITLEACDASGRVSMEAFAMALRAGGPRGPVRVVVVSQVSFCTGLAIDVIELARLCHEHGARLLVDMVQSIGCLSIDLGAMRDHERPDYIVGDARKYLGGLDGLGFLCATRTRHDDLRGVALGLGSLDSDGDALAHDAPLRPGAQKHEGGALSTVGAAALRAALAVWDAYGGATAIWRAVDSTIAAVLNERQNAAPAATREPVDGVWIPMRESHERSGIVVAYVSPDSVAARLARVERAGYRIGTGRPLPLPPAVLADAKLDADRAPARLVFSPHAYTPEAALREAMTLALPELADRLTA